MFKKEGNFNMAMLTRYRKSGGFLQLLQLIETCNEAKKEKLLENVRNENARWAQEIVNKMLSMERILSWDANVLSDISTQLQDLTLAVAFHGFSEEQINKFTELFSHTQKRKIEDLQAEKNPTPGEIATAHMKIIEEVRSMITNGEIYIKNIDPDLMIEDDIEEKLEKMPSMSNSSEFAVAEMVMPEPKTENLKDGEAKENLVKAVQQIRKLKDELMDFSYDEFIDRIIEEAKHILSLKHKLVGRERFEEFERFVVLSVTDDYWKNHLYEMDALRENSQMEAMGKQQDPLVIYKSSAFTMFTKLLDSMDEQILRLIWHVEIESSNSQYEAQDVSQLETVHEKVSGYSSNDSDIQKAGRRSRVQTIVREEPKVGRNDACPCGSGKKYKQCHGK